MKRCVFTLWISSLFLALFCLFPNACAAEDKGSPEAPEEVSKAEQLR